VRARATDVQCTCNTELLWSSEPDERGLMQSNSESHHGPCLCATVNRADVMRTKGAHRVCYDHNDLTTLCIEKTTGSLLVYGVTD
jgi:hypothetical protein